VQVVVSRIGMAVPAMGKLLCYYYFLMLMIMEFLYISDVFY